MISSVVNFKYACHQALILTHKDNLWANVQTTEVIKVKHSLLFILILSYQNNF